jgi:hypothetical protein
MVGPHSKWTGTSPQRTAAFRAAAPAPDAAKADDFDGLIDQPVARKEDAHVLGERPTIFVQKSIEVGLERLCARNVRVEDQGRGVADPHATAHHCR